MDRKNIFSFRLGVDLIELQKAKNFYRTHKDGLNSFFNDKEILYIRSSKRPHEALAALLAAKEAVFKALPALGTGIAAFRNIEISHEKGNQFSFPGLKLQVFKEKKYVVAHALGSDRKI